MKFTTKEELIAQAIQDDACKAGIKFAKSCKDLQEIFETIDANMLFWCLMRGYEQFAEYCDWAKLDGDDWSNILSRHPQYYESCDWSKLDWWDWSMLLSRQPQFKKYKK